MFDRHIIAFVININNYIYICVCIYIYIKVRNILCCSKLSIITFCNNFFTDITYIYLYLTFVACVHNY